MADTEDDPATRNPAAIAEVARTLNCTPEYVVEMRRFVLEQLRKCATDFGKGSCRSARMKARGLLRQAGVEPPPEDPRDARPVKGNERVPSKRTGRRR